MKNATDQVDATKAVTSFTLEQVKNLLDDSNSERELLIRLAAMIPDRIMVDFGEADATEDQLRTYQDCPECAGIDEESVIVTDPYSFKVIEDAPTRWGYLTKMELMAKAHKSWTESL